MLIQRYGVIAHEPPGADPTGRDHIDLLNLFKYVARPRARASGRSPRARERQRSRTLRSGRFAVSIREPHPPARAKILEIKRRLAKRARPIHGRSASVSRIRPFTGQNAGLFLASKSRPENRESARRVGAKTLKVIFGWHTTIGVTHH